MFRLVFHYRARCPAGAPVESRRLRVIWFERRFCGFCAGGGCFSRAVPAAIVGTNRAYPELLPDHLLNDLGRETIESIKDACVGGDGGVLGVGGGPSGSLANYTTSDDPFNTPGALSVRPKVTMSRWTTSGGLSPTTVLSYPSA